MRIGLGLGLTNARGAAPPPSTVTFASTALYPAYAYGGRYDLSDATKIKCMANNTAVHFRITGTDATLKVDGGAANPFWVSVDGGAETNPTVTGGKIVLLSGAAQATHTINIRANTGYTPGFAWITVASDTLSVTGVTPAHSADPAYGPVRLVLGGDSGSQARFAGTDPLNSNGGVAPAAGGESSAVVTGTGGNCGCGGYRFTATVESGKSIYVWCVDSDHLVLETDGVAGPIVLPPFGSGQYGWVAVGTGDGTQHEYRVTVANGDRIDAVMLGGAGSTFSSSALAARKYLFALGDSTTASGSCTGTSSQDSWAYQVARLVGADVEIGARGGDTTAQQNAKAAALIAALPSAPDATVILCGYNDADAPTTQTQYTNLLNTVLANTTGKIVAVQLYGDFYATKNVAIADAAAACNTPARVIVAAGVANFPLVTEPTVPTSGQIQTCDGLHNTHIGAARIAANIQADVASALA